MHEPIYLALTDDDPLFRSAMQLMVQDFEGIESVIEASDGGDLLEKLAYADPMPEVLLLDLMMEGMDGVETTLRVRAQYPYLRIIILSSCFSSSLVLRMLQMGVAAYLPKPTPQEELEASIRRVREKGFGYSETIKQIIHQKAHREKRVT
jgi:DNA-binding NarL/FixJ family response regulator